MAASELCINHPAYNAFWFTYHYGAPLNWSKKVIEETTTGNPADAAYFLVRYCGAPLDWGQKVIENATTFCGTTNAAFWLMCYCGAPAVWTRRIIEFSRVYDPLFEKIALTRCCGTSINHYRRLWKVFYDIKNQ